MSDGASETRLRRLRWTSGLRALCRETRLHREDFILPCFVIEGKDRREPVAHMPDVFRWTIDRLPELLEPFAAAGGRAVLVFGVPEAGQKDSEGTAAYSGDPLTARAVRAIKERLPDLVVITDVCLCAYTDHGHCGLVRGRDVDNDATLPLLARTAVAHARAGADVVAPSDMMDLRIVRIRRALDEAGCVRTAILSYAVKYASAFYGPFREAAHSAPAFGDRRSYQMDPGNLREAYRAARRDVAEGADAVMVKPALPYLDVIARLRERIDVPLAGYQVSGEYALLRAACGCLDERRAVLEALLAMKRAGCDWIITYDAGRVLGWLDDGR